MRVALADGERIGGFVELPGQKTVDHPRGQALRPQHYRHRGREVFAVTFFNIEEKIRERIGAAGFQIKCVSVVFAQVRFNRARRVIAVARAGLSQHLPGRRPDSRVKIAWQREVAGRRNVIVQAVCPQHARIRSDCIRIDLVDRALLIVRPALDRTFRIDAQERQTPLQRYDPRQAKQHRSVQRLNEEGLRGESAQVFGRAYLE